MIKKFLKSLEDPYRVLLGPNLCSLRQNLILLPKTRKIYLAIIMFIHMLVTLFVVTQYIEVYVLIGQKSDTNELLENIKVSMVSTVCVTKADTFVLWQKKWLKIIDYVTEEDNYERAHQDKTRKDIIDKYTKYCRRITYCYWAMIFLTGLTVLVTPLLKYVSSLSFREGLRNGTESFPHIFSSWVPFDKYHSPGCWFTVLWHSFITWYGASVMASYDTTVVVILTFFGGKIDLLKERAKQMLGSPGHRYSDEEATRLVKELHKAHVVLTEHSRLLNSLFSPVMFLYIVICSLMLSSSAYQLTNAINTTQTLLMAEYLIFGIMQLLVFCWHSNHCLVKNQNLMQGPYESEWWAVGVPQRKNIILLSGQFSIVHHFTAGPFTNLTLYTFITIMKGAYSYYTLLRE